MDEGYARSLVSGPKNRPGLVFTSLNIACVTKKPVNLKSWAMSSAKDHCHNHIFQQALLWHFSERFLMVFHTSSTCTDWSMVRTTFDLEFCRVPHVLALWNRQLWWEISNGEFYGAKEHFTISIRSAWMVEFSWMHRGSLLKSHIHLQESSPFLPYRKNSFSPKFNFTLCIPTITWGELACQKPQEKCINQVVLSPLSWFFWICGCGPL